MSTASAAACWHRRCAVSPRALGRASATCPTSSRCWPRPATWWRPSRPTTRPRSWAVNDRVQLAQAESELRRRTNLRWLRRGVTMIDPDRTYIDTTVHIGADVTLFPGTLLQGRTVDRRGQRDRPRRPARRLRGRAPLPHREHRGPPRRDRRRRPRRPLRVAGAGCAPDRRTDNRTVLHCMRRR